MRMVLSKIVRLVVVLFVVSFLSFWFVKLIGGNDDLVAKMIPFSSEQEKDRVRNELGLQDPFFAQYGHWVGNFVTGDFGQIYLGAGDNISSVPVSETVAKRLPVSLELMLYAQFLALFFAIPFGILSAHKASSRFDKATNVTAFGMLALPQFVAALLLVIFVGARWGWLPTQSNLPNFPLNPLDNWRFMLMPTVALALAQIAIYMRLLRSDMIATLQEDFITTAKAKGLPTRRVLLRHALRPSSLTLLTVAGLNVGALIGGAIIIERIFKVPGIGGELAEAIFRQQTLEIQSLVVLIAFFYVILNFGVDILYSVLDPRIRHARAVS
ncbi:MAG TPA: ABC transporter permease [Acidimicrobiia bacterium]|nr:ABC transporter permease [Acidimicrobiia bacterium]